MFYVVFLIACVAVSMLKHVKCKLNWEKES